MPHHLTPVSALVFGCQWRDGHVVAWPLLIRFGAHGPEVTTDDLLEGRGHAYLGVDQLVALIAQLADHTTPIRLGPGRPPGLARKLTAAGFYVGLEQHDQPCAVR